MKQIKVLILSGDKSPYRAVLKKALNPNFKVSFISAISEVSPSIGAFKPNLFIHDWTTTDDTQGRQFHLRYAQSTHESGGVVRIIVTTKVTPSLMAFATDAYIDKIIDYGTAKLNLSTQVEMLLNNSGHREILSLIKTVNADKSSYSQEEVDGMVESTFQKYPHDNSVKLEMGNLKLRKDSPDEASELAKLVLEEEPTNLRAINLMSRVSMKQGNFEEAFALLEKANSVSPNNADRLLLLGDACYGKGDLDAALGFYEEAADANPDKLEQAESNMGKVKIAQGDLESALSLLQRSASEEEAAGYFNNAAVVAVKKGQHADAVKLYETALKSLKTNKLRHIIYYNLALSHKRNNNLAECVKMLKRSLKYKPGYEKAEKMLQAIKSLSLRKSG